MNSFGLIGGSLTNSFSAKYFSDFFESQGIDDCEYLNFPLDQIEDIQSLLQQEELKGLNVTIPFKESVLEFTHEQSEAVKEIGAANVLVRSSAGWKAENTDYIGFKESIKKQLPESKLALVLGNGGASKAVIYALKQMNFKIQSVGRKARAEVLSYKELTPFLVGEHQLIVNTTPLGMGVLEGLCPELPYEALSPDHLLYDLVYTPSTTEFMKQGMKQGAAVKNGLAMLELQAKASWEIWKGSI